MNQSTGRFLVRTAMIACSFLLSFSIEAQISEGGIPPSFGHNQTLKSTTAPLEVPVTFSIEDLKMVDAYRVSQGAPLRLSKLIPVELDLENKAQQLTLPDGSIVWQLHLRAANALALMAYYSEFYIPEGGRLFLYNADKSQLIGAFTAANNPQTGGFVTEFIAGDELIFEYVPAASGEMPRIVIDQIGYGYNHLYVSKRNTLSGSCMVNINCEEGDAWQNQKKGVCRIVERIGDYAYLCTGSLVNNTDEDLTPYILSAFHCSEDAEGVSVSNDELAQWVFYFNYEYADCEAASIAQQRTMTGATKIASTNISGGSDGLLLKLNQAVPTTYDVYYNGWDRSSNTPQSGVNIHHPAGDYKKISTYNNPASEATWYGEDGVEGSEDSHWNVRFAATANGHGVTEGGSSGSPLFNENGLIVGTLSGGTSSCEKEELTGINLYGKISSHWNKYGTGDRQRMDKYLNPSLDGTVKLEGRYASGRKAAPTNLTAVYKQGTIQLNWSAPSGSDQPVQYALYDQNTLIAYASQTGYAYASKTPGTRLMRVSALYEDGRESAFCNATVVVPEYKSPRNVSAALGAGSVYIFWDAPEYLQTVTWSNTDGNLSQWSLGTEPVYVGQLWKTSDLTPVDQKRIKYVQFIPIQGADYTIYIKQGNRIYTQEVKTPLNGQLNSVQLNTPYRIDAASELVVATYINNIKAGSYPIVCDNGPAVLNKGNVASMDGESWETMYEPASGFTGNFYIGISISSLEIEAEPTAQTASVLTRSTTPVLSLNPTKSAAAMQEESAVSTRSVRIEAFTEPTAYRIYRNGTFRGESLAANLAYQENQPADGEYLYSVSALYGDEESEAEPASTRITTSNESLTIPAVTIYPARFGNQITLSGHEQVKTISFIAAGGQTMLLQNRPAAVIQTGSLPAGAYLIRMELTSGEVKVQKAVKSSM